MKTQSDTSLVEQSELIADVATDFNGRRFAETLQNAHVNSINLVAKCHHGWAYYDTKIAHKHPHLRIDLLGEQMAALQAIGIATHYYYSLVWDNRSALANPEWRARNKDGSGLYQGYWRGCTCRREHRDPRALSGCRRYVGHPDSAA